MDSHPMHTHPFTFRVMGRYTFDVMGFLATYGTPTGVPQMDVETLAPFLTSGLMTSGLMPLLPGGDRIQGTVKANPGQINVIPAQYRLPSGVSAPQKYVHHCHLLEHEDDDMMERFEVVAAEG